MRMAARPGENRAVFGQSAAQWIGRRQRTLWNRLNARRDRRVKRPLVKRIKNGAFSMAEGLKKLPAVF